jgi:hypothetical protein
MRRRNSLVDDIDKVRETLLNNINNHVIRINDPETPEPSLSGFRRPRRFS